MTSGTNPEVLLDRVPHLDALARALTRAAGRRGTTVVLSGPPGAGATALLDAAGRTAAASTAPRWRVVRGRATPDEAGIDNALLQQLVRPMVDALDQLAAAGEEVAPAPRAALDAVTGWAAPEQTQVPLSMAVLWALEALARRGPVLVGVDDVQWADTSSLEVLRFLCRRLAGTAVCLVIAAPGSQPALEWPDADVVVDVAPLSDDAAEELLDAVAPDAGPVVRERVLRLSDGRPRRLVDLARIVQRTGEPQAALRLRGAALPWVQRAKNELAGLDADQRRRLLLAGLLDDRAGLPHLRSAERALLAALDATAAAGGRPVARAVLDLRDDGEEEAVDPLLADLAADDADPSARLAGHAAWATVLEGAGRLETSAAATARLAGEAVRHRALALPGEPDPSDARRLAADLRRRGEALVRHDPRRAGDLLVLAGRLGDDDDRRCADLLRASELALAGGRVRLAAALELDAGPAGSPRALALAARARAEGALVAGEPGRAVSELVAALAHGVRAVGSAPDDDAEARSREAAATAAALAVVAPRGAGGPAAQALADAAAALREPTAGQVRRVATLLLPWRDATPADQQEALVEALELLDGSGLPLLRWAAEVARGLGRGDLLVAVARSRAATLTGPAAVDLHLARCVALLDTSIARAGDHLAQARRALRHAPEGAVAVAQAQTVLDVIRCQDLSDITAPLAPLDVFTTETAGARWAHAHVHRLRGEVDAAIAVMRVLWPEGAEPSVGALLSSMVYAQSLKEVGAPTAELARVVRSVHEWADGSDAPIARVSLLLGRMWLSRDPDEQLELLRSAAGLEGPALVTGSADLALGMMLRRARRAVDARLPLQRAADAFTEADMPGFARQAARELAATAPQRPLRRVGSRELTSQEREVAHLAAQGASNAEVALSLGISSRTVAHHLQHVYAKLGITGRQQLAARLDRV